MQSVCIQKDCRMNKKKVLFVIPYLYEGGAQRFLSNLQSCFPEDWEIETLVNSEYKKAYQFRGLIHTLDVNEVPRTGSVFFQFRVFVRRLLKLRKLKKTGEYSACVSMIDSSNVANILSGNRKCRTIISVVTSLSSIRNLPQYGLIVNPLAKLLYNRADNVVAVSEELRKELIDEFGINENRISAITTGCDINSINSRKLEPIEESIMTRLRGKRVICNVGRMSYPKGQWHLIRAFKSVKGSIPDAVLILAGEGELEKYLRDIIDRLDLSEDVILLGHTDNVYKYLNVSDVFAFPSLLEGFPNALAEALCVGIPCVATDFKTGARELLSPELLFNGQVIDKATECQYGLLTPICSGKLYTADEPLEKGEVELANALIKLLKNVDLSIRYRELSSIRGKDLDIKNTVVKWVKLLENEESRRLHFGR